MIEFNPSTKQVNAIKDLEEALRKCKNAGLGLFGMDMNLLVIQRTLIMKGKSMAEITEEYGQGAHSTINDHGCYIDSGGW